jgi:Leucine-rich repeat (LRR) protein
MGLISLKIENAQLVKLPEGIMHFKELEELSFKHTGLPYLPEGINQLKALRRLDLRGTNINSLPKGLDHLERIDLRMTDLRKADQTAIRDQYPTIKIFFSPPCNCK